MFGQCNGNVKIVPFLSYLPYDFKHTHVKDISSACRECVCIVPHSSASSHIFFESSCKLTLKELLHLTSVINTLPLFALPCLILYNLLFIHSAITMFATFMNKEFRCNFSSCFYHYFSCDQCLVLVLTYFLYYKLDRARDQIYGH